MLIFPVFDVDDMVDMIIGEIEGSLPPMTNLHSDRDRRRALLTGHYHMARDS